MRRRLALLALLCLPALVGTGGLLFQSTEVRIEGFLDGSVEQVKPWEVLDVQIGTSPQRKFALTNIISLSAGAVMGADILAAVEPIHPNFIFNGDPELLDEIASSLPNQYLKITGYTAFGPQRILVNRIEKSEPIIGPIPTPSLRKQLFGF